MPDLLTILAMKSFHFSYVVDLTSCQVYMIVIGLTRVKHVDEELVTRLS